MRNKKIAYDTLIDNILFRIDIGRTKGTPNEKILEEVRDILASNLISKPEQYESALSKPMMKALTKNYVNFVPNTLLVSIVNCLKYNPEVTYRKQLSDAFTMIEWYFNRQKVEMAATNWKDIMSKN